MLNQVLYLVGTLELCIYALYISEQEWTNKHCFVDSMILYANFTVSLDGYLWDVSSLVTEKIQIQCCTNTHIELITPLLTIIYVGNGYEGYSSNILMPAKSELTSTIDTTVQKDYSFALYA